MGAVYEGENLLIARRVAIKVLHGSLASQQGVVERFEREAQAAGRIGNDHILEVLDMGRLPNGDRFMVMEYLDGETLEQRCERLELLTPQQLYPLMRQLLAGLGAAHQSGIIHRDLKPDNIFILREKAGQSDFVKIIDFGISKFTALGNDMRMTATGAVMGTPYYMSPEQAKGSREADARSDLYAVGVILFKAVTGRVPFDAATFNELLFKIVLSEAPRPTELVTGLDPGFEALILKAMARDPNQRFQSAQHFIEGLDAWAHGGRTVSIPAESAADRLSLAQQSTELGLPASGASIDSKSAQTSSPGSTVAASAAFTASGGTEAQATQAAAPGGITHGSWSNSGFTLPKKTSLPVLLGLAAAAALVVVAVVLVWGGSEEPKVALDEGSEHSATSVAAEPSPPAAEVTPKEAPSKPSASSHSVDAGSNAVRSASAVSPRSSENQATAGVVAPKPAPPPRPVTVPRPAPKPQAAPSPQPAPPPRRSARRVAPKPAPAPKPSPARPSRSSEDDLFGY